jgi:peptide/nickel transport system substrate-binding protein
MKSVALVLLCIVSMITVLASCSGSATTTPATTNTSTKTTTATTSSPATTEASEPQYGGTLNVLWSSDPMGFDEAYTPMMMCGTLKITNEELLTGDWSKGPAGTGEFDWLNGYGGRLEAEVPFLAESWEMPDSTTIIFKIRQGVHFAINDDSAASKLVNGREITAEDVAYSLNRCWTMPGSFINTSNAAADHPTSIKAIDKYTVECKVPAQAQGLDLFICGDQARVVPQEVVDKYGDMKDWHNSVGTGPWIMKDYIPSSSINFVKNSNYWGKDPVHPQNTLPYGDAVKVLIITDLSTKISAIRTGKLDLANDLLLTWDDLQEMTKTYSVIQYKKVSGSHYALWGREDKQELPFKDVKVRQALNMAVDKQALIDSYYEGHADLFAPIYPFTDSFAPLNTPLEEMPQAVQELFKYNPDKAKELLKEAGYPNGFDTKVTCVANDADFLAIIVEDWKKIGVNLEIQQLETGVYNSVMRGRTFEQMLYKESVSRGFAYKMSETHIENGDDVAFFDSEITRKAYNEVQQYVGKDDKAWMKIVHDVYPYIVEQAIGVWLPVPHVFRVWQPWIKGFHGEYNVGYDNQQVFMQYVWIDQATKKSLGK